jgi:hypothetical protein
MREEQCAMHGAMQAAAGAEATGDGKVIRMAGFREARRFRAVGLVESYWHALRGPRPVPARAEVDPRGIEDALEYAFILERIAPRQGRLRIAGRHLSDLAGAEARGMPLSALFAGPARETLGDALEAVMARPAIARLALEAQTGFGRPALTGRLLLLPLLSDAGEVNRALGCLETEGRIGRTPRLFTTAEVALDEIAGAPDRAPAPGLAEPARAYDAPPHRGAPHLRLVKSDNDG